MLALRYHLIFFKLSWGSAQERSQHHMAVAAAARLHLHPHLCRTPRAATLHRTPVRVRTATSASAPLAITAAPANARASGRVLLLVRV
jgi:hypothetical protein